MNNVTRDGRWDLARKRYVPVPSDLERFLIRDGDVLFNATNSAELVGKTALVSGLTEPTTFSNHFLRLRPDPTRVEPAFLARWLQWQFRRGTFEAMCQRWVGQAAVKRKRLLSVELRLPGLDEQRRIARILDAAEALRVKRREAAAWTARLPQSLLAQTISRLPNELGPSCALASFVAEGDRINYGVVQPGADVDGGVPLIRAGDLVDGKVRRDKLRTIDPAVDASYRRSRLVGNEILVSCVGSIGAVAMTNPNDIGSNIVRAIARVPIASAPLRGYIAAYLGTAHVQRYFVAELRTVAQPTLNIKQIRELAVPVPPDAWLNGFATRAAAIDRLLERQLAQLTNLDALFAALQHRAFSEIL